jgi:hypothetical protein
MVGPKRNQVVAFGFPQDPASSSLRSSSVTTPASSTKSRRKVRPDRATLPNKGIAEQDLSHQASRGMIETHNDTSVQEAMRARGEEYHKRVHRMTQEYSKIRGQPPPNPQDMTEEELQTYKRKQQIMKAVFESQLENAKALYQPPIAFHTMLCGTGDMKQLGTLDPVGKSQRSDGEEHTDESLRFRPNTHLKDFPIIQVACGGLHNLALHADGRHLFSWGVNDTGPLGRITLDAEKHPGTDQMEHTAKPVDTPPNMGHIVKVAAGDCSSIAITLKGKVYTWGSYRDKEAKEFCDVEERGPDSYTLMRGKKIIGFQIRNTKPIQVHMPPNTFVEDVACGEAFNAVRTSGLDLLTWGYSEVGGK